MINKETLMKYYRITSGSGFDSDFTLVNFSLTSEDRDIINLVNNEAKKDKKLANLLEDLKYSNNKVAIIEEYFANEKSSKNYGKEKIDNFGFVNMAGLASIVGIVTLILSLTIAIGTK